MRDTATEMKMPAVGFVSTRRHSLTAVRDGLWRVSRRDGHIVGHIERILDSAGDRYSARRLRRPAPGALPAGTLALGVFWRLDDAQASFDSA